MADNPHRWVLNADDPYFAKKERENMMIDARELAKKYTLAELAHKVSEAAPQRRGHYISGARIPWTIIMAIRFRTGEAEW